MLTDGMGDPLPSPLAVEISLHPRALVSAWRPDARVLVLPVQARVPARRRVEARIRVAGLDVSATITGRVVSAARGAGPRIEVEPDEARLDALERLVAAASGAPSRPARLVAAILAVVHGPSGPTRTVTQNVSARGCRLAWTGAAPRPGTPVATRLGYGTVAATLYGEFRWATAGGGAPPAAGLCFHGGELDALERMLATLRHQGAPAA